jgi:peptidoglycan/LPS O-acetylase OafA/YrhL
MQPSLQLKATNRRNVQLDLLRGIAILLVFGRHLEISRPNGVMGVFAEGWFRIGWLGVDLFFVLSGFLIGGLLLSEYAKHGKIDVTRFYVRRGLKIYPPYLVFLAYLILVPCVKALSKGGDALAVFATEWGRYWPNFLFLQNYVGQNPAGHTWTLAVEEHFYLLLPLLLWFLARSGRMRMILPVCGMAVLVCLSLRCLSIGLNDPYAVKMAASHFRLDALLFGVGLRAIAQFYPERFAATRRWRGVLLISGVLLWVPNLFVEPGSVVIRTIGLTGTFLGSAAFLIAAYQTKAADFGRFSWIVGVTARGLAWIGFYSYAIYLWHVTAMGILERVMADRLSVWLGGSGSLWWLACAGVISTGAILAGVAAAKIVEWPVLRIRDRYFPTRSGTLPAPATPSGSGEAGPTTGQSCPVDPAATPIT